MAEPIAATGFWAGPAAVPVIAGLAALLVGVAVGLVLAPRRRDTVRHRIGSFVPVVASDAPAPDESGRDGARRPSVLAGDWWRGYVEAVEVSRSTRPASWLMRRAAIVAVVLAPICVLLTRQPGFALVPLLLFAFVERWRVMRAAQKQRDRFADTLPGYLQDMASAMRVGRSLPSALAVVATSADEPTRSELERAVTDESLGRPLEESLIAVGLRMRSADIEQVALVAELNRRSGSNVAEALDRVAEGARERGDLRREVRALTAQAKMSSSVLTGLPVVLLLGLSLVAPAYSHPLFHTPLGIVALVIAAALIVAGWKVMRKISAVSV